MEIRKELRLELGITPKELGEKISVEKSTINKYKLGKIAIPYKKIEKIAAALETTPAYLMGWDKEKPTTLAAHFDGDEYTEDELDEIKQFAEFVKGKRGK